MLFYLHVSERKKYTKTGIEFRESRTAFENITATELALKVAYYSFDGV